MSHKPGTHLGGVRTVEDLMQRCYVDPVSGCWHCRLYLAPCGSPQVTFVTPDTGLTTKTMGRRAALYLSRGKPLPSGFVAFATDDCESKDCVNPAHCRQGTKKTWGKAQARLGRMKTPAKAAAAREQAKAKRILTAEQVREIRLSEESNAILGERMGVSSFAVWAVRVGRTHRHVVTAPNSIFNLAA